MNDYSAAMLQVVRTLPEQTLTATMRNPRGVSTRAFRGALLYDYCHATGMVPQRQGPVGPGNHYIVATAEDGFAATLAWFEVMPRASAKQVLLAFEQDAEPVRAGIRLIVPGDDLGGRSIFGLAGLDLRSTQSATSEAALPPTDRITVGGMVDRPLTLTAADLAGFARHEVETVPMTGHGGVHVPARRFAGALLWDVLEGAGITVDPEINEDILRRIVIARGADGRAAAIAPGEIEPRFMGGQVLIATHCDGAPLLPDEGALRLVLPQDHAEGRAIKQLESLEVRLG